MRRRTTVRAGAARWAGLKVGLLGGSFNPAHEGHLHISLEALKRLDLDFVWWLVSPQNPLKSEQGMGPFPLRYASAHMAARHPRIRVSDLECLIRTQFTADSLRQVVALFPRTRFVWLMGADNLQQFHKWQRWHEIMNIVPVAIFDRPSYSISALTAKMPLRFARHRLSKEEWQSLATRTPPAWAFVECPRHPASATQIRAARPSGAPSDLFVKD